MTSLSDSLRRQLEKTVVDAREVAVGGASAAVGRAKQRDIETAAVGYLRVRGLTGLRVRFDVVTVEPANGDSSTLVVRHLPGAFQASGRYRA